MKKRSLLITGFTFICCGILRPDSAIAQDLEPRRWTPLPLGTNVVGAGYAHTTGDLAFDPVLQIQEATVEADTWLVSHVNSFSLAGKLARFDMILPWQKARWEGLHIGVPTSVERTGLADPRLRLSVNLLGVPDAGAEVLGKYMAKHTVNTVVGAAVAVSLPLGKYYSDKLLNLGENRFTIRPQIGVVHTRGPWSFELTGSVFLFTDNNDFFNGKTREQDPFYAMQAHVVHTFKPGMWASLSAGYGKGGSSTIDGVDKDDERANFLSALSFGVPLSRTQGLKIAYIRSRKRENVGSDTDSVVVGWSVLY